MHATLAILAGGRGTRMGLPKSWLRVGGRPGEGLLDRVDLVRVSLDEARIAGRIDIGFECDQRSNELIELEAVFQHDPVDEPAVGPNIARLDAERITKRLARPRRVGVEEGRETPQHRVAVPVSGGHVIAVAARGHAGELLGIDRATPAVVGREQEISVHDPVEVGIAGGPRVSVRVVSCLGDESASRCRFDPIKNC